MDDRYMAGLFDGEGCVRISRWKKPNSTHVRYTVYVSIGMSYRPIIESIAKEYGGSLHENRHDLRHNNNRIQFMCIWGSQEAATFLRRILPYAVVKRHEIELALKLQDHIDQNKYKSAGRNHLRENRDEILEFRHKLYELITIAKKQSYPSLTTDMVPHS